MSLRVEAGLVWGDREAGWFMAWGKVVGDAVVRGWGNLISLPQGSIDLWCRERRVKFGLSGVRRSLILAPAEG